MPLEKRLIRWEDIEAGLGSPGRLRILREMIKKSEEYFTKYALEKATGLKPIDVRKNLRILVKIGWVEETPYKPKTYRIKMENDAVKIIADLFRRVL